MNSNRKSQQEIMNEPSKPTPEGARAEPAESLVLDLNFVPDWARQPPTSDPYAHPASRHDEQRRPDAPGRRSRAGGGPDRGSRRDHGRPARAPGDGRRPPSGRRGSPGAGPRHAGPGHHPQRQRPAKPPPPLPLQITFLPEQKRLATVIADIRLAGHAYPLPELAHLFLSQPDWHVVKIEVNKRRGGAYVTELYQSRLDGQLFRTREAALAAASERALQDYFETERLERDPPSGHFVCVARCRLSGTLLGPPNFHGYNDALNTLHRERFAHLPIDAYRREIETVRDPELIERWKDEWRTQTQYRLKPEHADPNVGSDPLDAAAARAYIEETVAPKQVATVHRAVISGPLSRELRDPELTRALRAAWTREQRFPHTLIRALRGACRRLGLHLFESKQGAQFVTPTEPRPIDPGHVIEVIRELIEWLKAHPGCSRQELVTGLRPDAGNDPARLGEVLQPLSWLVDKGHVIEFHNGTLAVPKDTPTATGKA